MSAGETHNEGKGGAVSLSEEVRGLIAECCVRCGGMPAHGADLPARIAKLEAVAEAAWEEKNAPTLEDTWAAQDRVYAALAAWKEGK